MEQSVLTDDDYCKNDILPCAGNSTVDRNLKKLLPLRKMKICDLSFRSRNRKILTMPSLWRYFCCICNNADHKRTYSARHEWTSRRKSSRRSKSGKNTWARRSLLDNDQIEINDFTGEQMRVVPTPTFDQEGANDESFQARLLDHFAPKKRPTVHDVFDNSHDESSASKTTFPWMDERFVPNGRIGTRLGISAVQMNAKRNGVAIPQNSAIQTTNIYRPTGRPHSFTAAVKSQSFTEGKTNENSRVQIPHLINPINTQVKNVQNGHVLWNNFNTAPKEAINIRQPVRLGVSSKQNDKRMVLKASTSDVGVRRVSSKQTQSRQDKIPKLEDYPGINNSSIVAANHVSTDNARPSITDIFPSSMITDTENEVEADLSYASEIIFRKQPSEYSGSEVPLKRSNGPEMFSTNTSKYERLKPERLKSESSKSQKQTSKAKYSKLKAESMYGYVPKAVQNVHASNALEGNKIDDFFMQRMHERHLENFASLDDTNLNDDQNTIIITSVVESTEDLTKLGKTDDDVKLNEALKTKQTTTSAESNSNMNDCESKILDSTNPQDKSIASLGNSEQKTQTLNDTDDKVIMIDFPPNPENNNNKSPALKKNLKSVSSDESNSDVCQSSTTTQMSKIQTGEVLY